MKVCSKCGVEKELTEYTKDKSKKDGYRTECTQCKRKAKLEARVLNALRLEQHPELIPLTKVCHKCKVGKPKDDFVSDMASRDGLFSQCKQCQSKHHVAWATPIRETIRAKQKKRRADNPDSVREKERVYYSKTVVQRRASNRKHYYKHRDRILTNVSINPKTRIRRKLYKSKNKHKTNAISAKRRARLLNATPPWLTADHYAEIEKLYKQAQTMSEFHEIPFHVDHIIPLQGKTVSGLHVPWNLRILPGKENISKGNRLLEDCDALAFIE